MLFSISLTSSPLEQELLWFESLMTFQWPFPTSLPRQPPNLSAVLDTAVGISRERWKFPEILGECQAVASSQFMGQPNNEERADTGLVSHRCSVFVE